MSVFFLIMSLEQGIILKHRTISICLLLPTLNRELYSYLLASCCSNIPTLPIFWELLLCSVLLSGKLFPWVFSSFRYVLIYHLKNSSFTTLYDILTPFNAHFVLWNGFLFLIKFIITTSLCTLANSDLTFWEHMDCSSPVSSVHGISQAKIQEWAAISFSRASSRSRNRTRVSCIGRQILYHWATREAIVITYFYLIIRSPPLPLLPLPSLFYLRYIYAIIQNKNIRGNIIF